jgi:hypothetical protein
MFSKGDELFDKRLGERHVELAAVRDSGGELARIEDTAAPVSQPTADNRPSGTHRRSP